MISKLLVVSAAIVACNAQQFPKNPSSYCGWAPDNLSEATPCSSIDECRGSGHGFMGCFPRVPITPHDVPQPAPPALGYCGWAADNLNIASPCKILDNCVGGHGFVGCFQATAFKVPAPAKPCASASADKCTATNAKCTEVCKDHGFVANEECYGSSPTYVRCMCNDGTDHFDDVCAAEQKETLGLGISPVAVKVKASARRLVAQYFADSSCSYQHIAGAQDAFEFYSSTGWTTDCSSVRTPAVSSTSYTVNLVDAGDVGMKAELWTCNRAKKMPQPNLMLLGTCTPFEGYFIKFVDDELDLHKPKAVGAGRLPRSYCGWAPDNLSESTVCDSMNDCRTGHGFMGCFPRVPVTPHDVPRPSPPSVGYCGWSADNLNIASPCQILDDCVGGHGFMGCFSALPAAALGAAADGSSAAFSKAAVQTKSETCIAGSGPCIDGHRTCTSYTRDTDVCPCGTTYRDHSADDGHAACCGDGCPTWRKDFSVLAQLQAFMRTGAELLQARLQQLP